MLAKLIEALKSRQDLAAWSVRHVLRRSAQAYAVPKQTEAERTVVQEEYKLEVLRNTTTTDGSPAVGNGYATLLPEGDITASIDQAALVAVLMANPIYSLPRPTAVPDIPLVDTELANDPQGMLDALMDRLRKASAKHKEVRLTSAECFGEIQTTHLVNSRGIDAEQKATEVALEFVLQAQRGERHSEMLRETTKRRTIDLNIELEVERRARYTTDLLETTSPPSWQGAVVLRDAALVNFMMGDELSPTVLRTLGSAASKYSKISPWEIGKSVFRGEVKGDPLTVWASRALPYGTNSSRFDNEGLPGQRIDLIRDNKLVAFAASQRYAEYLKVPATGDFGNAELPTGSMPAASLLAEPCVEVCQFSWFNPNPVTGDFSAEIRLGYIIKNGKATPFKGGQLVGNVLDALADVHWSKETAFFGGYLGPHTARFNNLKVAGG